MTKPLDLDALEAAARAATPGPWEVLGNGDTVWSEDNLGGICVAALGDYPDRDAEFIASADPSTILALIDRLRDAEARLQIIARERNDYWEGWQAAEARIEAVRRVLRLHDDLNGPGTLSTDLHAALDGTDTGDDR